MSNEFEQPVEPMSRAEEILREENVQRPMSRVEDLLQQLVASGSNVTVTPTLNTGVPLAYVTINGVEETIYAPEDVVGSIVTVSPTYDTGTLVATITVNDVPYYIYVPENDDVEIFYATFRNDRVTLSDAKIVKDISNALNAGKFVVIYTLDNSSRFVDMYQVESPYNISCIKPSLGKVFYYSTNSITSNRYDQVSVMELLPSVTSSDEGKVAMVNSGGKWFADTIPTELPSVTSSDEGKVLTVNSSGEWNAESPSGGDIVVLPVTMSGTVIYLPTGVTAADVFGMLKNGKNVILYHKVNNNNFEYYYSAVGANSTAYFMLTEWSFTNPAYVLVTRYRCSNNSNINYLDRLNYTSYAMLPSVTSSDEGKVLTVNSSGQWVASNIPDGTNTAY